MLASEIRIYVLSCTLFVLGDHINRVRLISGSTAEGTRCSEDFHHGLADSDSNLIRTDATTPITNAILSKPPHLLEKSTDHRPT